LLLKLIVWQNSEFLMAAKEPVNELKDAKEIRILAFSDARIVSGRTQSTAGVFFPLP
jgi:hypothetical protein